MNSIWQYSFHGDSALRDYIYGVSSLAILWEFSSDILGFLGTPITNEKILP